MTFDEARQAKFEKGAKEHQQPWDKEHIDHLKEIQDELLDLYNYASLDTEDPDMTMLMAFCKEAWIKIQDKVQ